MSKFFFKGRIETREKYQRFGYNTNRQIKSGSQAHPLQLVVNSKARQQEIIKLLKQHDLHAQVTLEQDQPENILELEVILGKPQTQKSLRRHKEMRPAVVAVVKNLKNAVANGKLIKQLPKA